MNVQQYLGREQIEFDVIEHHPTYSAQRLAQQVHVSGKEVAKTVLLRTDGIDKYVVAVLQANQSIDLQKAANAIGCSHVKLATEVEISQRCTDCQAGALPPFGSQYGMRTMVEKSLLDDDEIVFEGNTHDKAIRMSYADFDRLEQPLLGSFAYGG